MDNTMRSGNPRVISQDLKDRLLRKALGLRESEPPFPWQRELLECFLRGAVVRAVDVPTGLGKTSVMAIWLVARALGAPVPCRMVYVVDRRAVVDQATVEAERLRGWVVSEPAVAAALGLGDQPLPISTLRGQHVDNRQWLEDPSVPAIVLGTVDMIGSRLLFSGYGVSQKMRPYHAGLLGVDALIVLDEAHLVPPFERLIEQIASGVDAHGRPLGPRAEADRAVLPPLQFLSLSATGRERSGDKVLRLTDADRDHEVVCQRLEARKRLVIRAEVEVKGLADTLAQETWALSYEGKIPCRIIVFCTSRSDALKVREALYKLAADSDSIEVELFVGARRVYEREAAANWLAEHGFLAGASGRPTKPTFLVVTSAGEVGVDLDADHAVCDVVAWERMVQRFGRVNRRGEGDATIVIVPTVPDEKAQEAVAKLRKWQAWAERMIGDIQLSDAKDDFLEETEDGSEDEEEQAGNTKRKDGEPQIKPADRRLAKNVLRQQAVLEVLQALRPAGEARDASPAALLELRERAERNPDLKATLRQATSPDPLHPPLTRALVEAWSMTSLDEHTGRPEVAPWIRGWPEEDEAPQTTLVWRAFLPVDATGRPLTPRDIEAFRDAADPHLAECLETDTGLVLDWLNKRIKTLGSRQEMTGECDRFERPLCREDVVAIIFRGTADPVIIRGEPLTGGSKDEIERLLHGAILMVDRRLGGLKKGVLDTSENEPALDVTDQLDVSGPVVPFRIRRVRGADMPGTEEGWRAEACVPIAYAEDAAVEWLVIESVVGQAAGSEEGRSGARRAQLLDEHEEWTEQEARRVARAVGLPDELTEVLALAGRLHDEGKRAIRWQRAFRAPNGGNPPYAKTVGRPDLALLEGYRHELGSLPYAESFPRVAALPTSLRDLCLHLIAAHHGHARPLLETSGAPEPPTRLKQHAQEIALRFVALEKQWGPWGLAWFEALLRAADQQASRRNDLERGNRG